jgi:hypothetical protein
MNRTRRTLTVAAWGALIVTRGLLFVAPALLGWVQLLSWALSLAALFWLLGVHNRCVAQWRVVIPSWLVYCGLRWLATRLPLASNPILSRNLANLVTVLVMDALISGYAGLVILAIRRDVSVAYVVLATLVGGVALRGQVQASGGVLNWLLGTAATSMQQGFSVIEPLIMVSSCMISLGILTLLPHLLWLIAHELRVRG